MADHYNRGIGGSKITDVNPKNKKVDENGYYNASKPIAVQLQYLIICAEMKELIQYR